MNSTNKTIAKVVGIVFVAVLVGVGGIATITHRLDIFSFGTSQPGVPTTQTTQDYAEPQITGSGLFKMVSLEMETGGKTTHADPALLERAQPLTVVAENGAIRSQLADGKESSLVEGNWVSSRGLTYDAQQLVVDTYTSQGTNSNDGTPTETITIVVSNLTTGLITIHQEFKSRTGTAKFNYERVGGTN